jgi:hypothetical protein
LLPLTSSPSTTHRAVTWVVAIPTDIPYTRIIQPRLAKLLAVHVLDTPKTSCSDGGSLRARGRVHGCGGGVGHCAEGAEEFGQKGHGEVGEGYEEEEAEELQFEGLELDRVVWQ